MIGKKSWTIADGYMSNTQNGDYVSHEAVCILNLSDQHSRMDAFQPTMTLMTTIAY